MPSTIPIETFKAQLLEFFAETFDSVKGIYLDTGTSLFETLETIDAAEASRPLSASCGTIAAQVNHVAAYLRILAQYARGEDPGKVDWDATWDVGAVAEPEWAALTAGLRAARAEAQATVEALDLSDDPDHIGDAMALVVHTAYHLGEIRQALCAIRGSAS